MKILIVEDDLVSQTLMSHMLQSLGESSLARNGEDAIRLFESAHEQSSPFDLVCLDIMMPGKSGQDVLLAIREFESSRGIGLKDGVKVIMTTGLSDAENVVTAFEHGCGAYVTKPIDRQVLFSTLRQLGIPVDPPRRAD